MDAGGSSERTGADASSAVSPESICFTDLPQEILFKVVCACVLTRVYMCYPFVKDVCGV